MSKEVIKQLREIRQSQMIGPDKTWVKNNRDLLMSQIKNTVNSETVDKKINAQNLWNALSVYGVVRPLAVLLLAFGITSGGWIASTEASQNSVPGDWLYPVKRSAEKTKIAMATLVGAKTTETQYRVDAIKQRVQEMKQIIDNDNSNKNEMAASAISDMNKEIVEVNKNLEQIKSDKSILASGQVVKNITAQTTGMTLALKEAQNGLIVAGGEESKDLLKEITTAKDGVKSVENKAVEVVVTKHLEGDKTVTPQDVNNIVGTALDKALNEVKETKESLENVGKVVAEVKTVTETKITTGTPIINVLSSVKNVAPEVIGTKIQEVAGTTEVATVKTEQASGAVQQKVNEVKEMLNSGNLNATLVDKLNAVNTAVQEADKIKVDALSKAVEVLPVVKVVKEDGTVAGVAVTTTVATGTVKK